MQLLNWFFFICFRMPTFVCNANTLINIKREVVFFVFVLRTPSSRFELYVNTSLSVVLVALSMICYRIWIGQLLGTAFGVLLIFGISMSWTSWACALIYGLTTINSLLSYLVIRNMFLSRLVSLDPLMVCQFYLAFNYSRISALNVRGYYLQLLTRSMTLKQYHSLHVM